AKELATDRQDSLVGCFATDVSRQCLARRSWARV
ncbi:hypothetical protein A2U01_0067440, partial [Trifolium medium]|nr:hypothetical protein [Trifolium medium]